MFGSWRRQRARQELDRVSSTLHCSPLDEALSDLDEIDTRTFSPYEVALWLNNRAYVLALLGSTAQAFDSLSDADELLIGTEESEPAHDVDMLRACIIGTRGIALLHAGKLDEAEAHLQDAFDRGAPHLTSDDAGVRWQEQNLAAERLWWLGLIAHKRGDETRRRDLLQRASKFDETAYGQKARQALEQH
jgi:hypothetical protein